MSLKNSGINLLHKLTSEDSFWSILGCRFVVLSAVSLSQSAMIISQCDIVFVTKFLPFSYNNILPPQSFLFPFKISHWQHLIVLIYLLNWHSHNFQFLDLFRLLIFARLHCCISCKHWFEYLDTTLKVFSL